MKENICIIPINDVFMPKDGCPLCRLNSMLEQRQVEYITGAAMMEPDVRINTNKAGFCHRHFSQMITSGKRLPNALMLESHLAYIREKFFSDKQKFNKKLLKELEGVEKSCFVCEEITKNMRHMYETIFKHWKDDADFKQLYNSQPYLCLPHFIDLVSASTEKGGLSGKDTAAFYSDTLSLAKKQLDTLEGDIKHFCTMFDYRSAGSDWGNSKDAIERTVLFLTGDSVQQEDASSSG